MSQIIQKAEQVQVKSLDELMRLLREKHTKDTHQRMGDVTGVLNSANNVIRGIHVGRSIMLRAIHELSVPDRLHYINSAVPELLTASKAKKQK